MAKWIFTRPDGPWQYPTLGFTATAGDVIENAAAIDPWWEPTDPSATVTIPATPGGGVIEPAGGSVLTYDRAQNGGIWTPFEELGIYTEEELTNKIVFLGDSSYLGLNRQVRPITGGAHAAPREVSSVSTVGTHRVPYIVAISGGNLRLEYGHHFQTTASPGGDGDPAGAITFSAAVEIDGILYRATFGGRTTATLDPGGILRSDPVAVEAVAGATIFVRTYLASGTAYANRTNFNNPGGRYTNNVVGGGGFASGVDLTAPGSAAITDAEAQLFGPMAIYADSSSPLPTVIGSGDSIMAGQGDSNDTGGHINAQNAGGWFERAFTGKRPHVNLSKPGEKASEFVVPANHRRRARFITAGSWVICAYGRNDILNTVPQIKAALAAHWLLCVQRGARVAQTTVTPETLSTDNWATVANQTHSNAGREATRLEINAWLRGGAPLVGGAPAAIGAAGAVVIGEAGHPVRFLIDTADAVESSRNSGLFKAPGYVYDGLHPLAAGHAAMAAAVDVARFV